jgi:hypothetical protein
LQEVRLRALQCLEAVTVLPYHKIFPQRVTVTNALAAALDDPKRIVRKQAVRCRNEWFVLSKLAGAAAAGGAGGGAGSAAAAAAAAKAS